MVIAGGQDRLQHHVFRIGTIGWIGRADIDALMHALDDVL
jgi:aspartate aminotransferase-like enzyme